MIPRPPNPIVVALDVSDLERADALTRTLEGEVGLFKVGLELFTAFGPEAVRRVRERGSVFLDLKLHDIPNTVERTARNCARLGVSILTVHALGGEAMIAAAVRGASIGAEASGTEPPSIAAVTVLSSMGGESLASPTSLAFEAMSAGATGVVASGEDVSEVRGVVGDAFCLIVPGIRPAGTNGHDQVRVLAPEEAVEAGAVYLVIGRPITDSPDPAGTARSILTSIR
ncbi:MAG TPA: orotidine-5'-phosphate decarboxylase [Actinomycetota bacterium]|nr:orotidine-5'-phosphate decarboxylase [Actinomycetota bacterium]